LTTTDNDEYDYDKILVATIDKMTSSTNKFKDNAHDKIVATAMTTTTTNNVRAAQTNHKQIIFIF